MKKQKKRDKGDWAIPAFMFIGIGVGLLTGKVAAFTMIGLGVGLFVSYLGRKK